MALARCNTLIDTRSVLPAIQVPTLILHRTGDRDVKVEEARYLADRIPGATLVELAGDDHLIYAGDVDPLIDEVQRFVHAVDARRPAERVLSTIAVVDAKWGDAAAAAMVLQQCTAHRGKLLRSSATQWIVSFDGPGRAIRAACTIVAATPQSGLALRAAIHTGECEVTNGTLAGPPVVIASELAAAAAPGSVLVTRTVADLMVGSPFRFVDRGKAHVREIGGWSIYEAVVDPRAR
jgi:class 3 adenylate cyclase